MRVGLVVYDGLDATTGGFVYDRRVAAGLRDRGDRVTVVPLPWRSYPVALAHNLDPRVGRRLATAAASTDVVVEDELCHPSLVRANRRLDAPLVAVVHHLRSSEPHPRSLRRLYRAVERRYLETVDGLVYSSRATRAAVEGVIDPPAGAVVHPAGDRFDPSIDADDVEARARDSGPLRVVFLGSLVPRKGLHTLLRGLARLPEGAWELTAVGDPAAAPRYVRGVRRLIDRLGVGDAVTIAGRLPDDDLASVLERSHLLAVPSAYEGFGVAYLEGMGFGLPALATTAGGADEVVTDGENGFLVPPEDPGAVAEAVGSFLDDRDGLARMGNAALERYAAHHGWDEVAGRVREFLGEVVDGR